MTHQQVVEQCWEAVADLAAENQHLRQREIYLLAREAEDVQQRIIQHAIKVEGVLS